MVGVIPRFLAALGAVGVGWGVWLLAHSPSFYEYKVSRTVDLVVFIGGGLALAAMPLLLLYIEYTETAEEVGDYHV